MLVAGKGVQEAEGPEGASKHDSAETTQKHDMN